MAAVEKLEDCLTIWVTSTVMCKSLIHPSFLYTLLRKIRRVTCSVAKVGERVGNHIKFFIGITVVCLIYVHFKNKSPIMEVSISHRVASLLLLTEVICELTISSVSFLFSHSCFILDVTCTTVIFYLLWVICFQCVRRLDCQQADLATTQYYLLEQSCCNTCRTSCWNK